MTSSIEPVSFEDLVRILTKIGVNYTLSESIASGGCLRILDEWTNEAILSYPENGYAGMNLEEYLVRMRDEHGSSKD